MCCSREIINDGAVRWDAELPFHPDADYFPRTSSSSKTLPDIYASLIISRTSGFYTFSMRTFKITTTYPVDRSAFLLSVRAPQHEDQALQVSAQPLHHSVCERLPSFVFVRVGLVCSHSQHSVQQQDACKVTNGFKLLRSF